MDAPSETKAAHAIDRREAIRRAALLAGVTLSPRWLTLAESAALPAQQAYLAPAQATIAAAIVDRIIPRTDTPGAADVGVPAFIDRLYGEFMSDTERQLLVKGLTDVEAAAKSAHGTSFSSLPASRQDEVLQGIAKAEQDREQGAFALIRSVTVLGYFTSEQVGRNVLHYDPVPGRYDACVPIDEVGRRNWTT
ncbi:MAG: gluconate 2-dehydrogenase subunit 3 family protein [Vicinamibacterales bacterium]